MPMASLYGVNRGTCLLSTGDRSLDTELLAGDCILMPAPVEHHFAAIETTRRLYSGQPSSEKARRGDDVGAGNKLRDGRQPASLTCAFFTFRGEKSQSLRSSLPRLVHVKPCSQASAPLSTTLQTAQQEWNGCESGGRIVVDWLLQILLVQLVRAYLADLPCGGRSWIQALVDPDVGPALGWIHRQPDKAWTVASLAHKVAMSRSTFHERFTQAVGMSPMRYLREYRMQIAGSSLRKSRAGLKAIAADVGYASVSAFSNAFRHWSGTAPSDYRLKAPEPVETVGEEVRQQSK